MSRTKEARRLEKLAHTETANIARRYKVPENVANAIDRAGKIHGQKSRAIQIGVEILWRSQGPPNIAYDHDSPLVGRTYKLPPRTIKLIEALSKYHKFTQVQVLAAVAGILTEPAPQHRKDAIKCISKDALKYI